MDKTSKNSSFIKLGFSSKVAMMGLIHNPLRTALTVLGVTIGVASVISLMGIGEGARVAVMDQFESLGTNVIKVAVHDKAYEFEPEYADELATRVQGVNFASPVVNVETQMKWKRDRTDVHVLGTNEQLRYIRDYEIVDGHFISEY
ncbi:MAG: ABC transporter permease, partial [Peptostreptococcales bacterium]